MADQSVAITSVPDTSEAKVAFDLAKYVVKNLPEGKQGVERIEQVLHLVSACRAALRGQSFSVDPFK